MNHCYTTREKKKTQVNTFFACLSLPSPDTRVSRLNLLRVGLLVFAVVHGYVFYFYFCFFSLLTTSVASQEVQIASLSIDNHHLHHQRVILTRGWSFLALRHPLPLFLPLVKPPRPPTRHDVSLVVVLNPTPRHPPQPPTRHDISLVVVVSSPGPSSTTMATNETRCLVRGHSQRSQSLFNHHSHQRDTMSRWWSFSALQVPLQPPQPPTRCDVSLVVVLSAPGPSEK